MSSSSCEFFVIRFAIRFTLCLISSFPRKFPFNGILVIGVVSNIDKNHVKAEFPKGTACTTAISGQSKFPAPRTTLSECRSSQHIIDHEASHRLNRRFSSSETGTRLANGLGAILIDKRWTNYCYSVQPNERDSLEREITKSRHNSSRRPFSNIGISDVRQQRTSAFLDLVYHGTVVSYNDLIQFLEDFREDSTFGVGSSTSLNYRIYGPFDLPNDLETFLLGGKRETMMKRPLLASMVKQRKPLPSERETKPLPFRKDYRGGPRYSNNGDVVSNDSNSGDSSSISNGIPDRPLAQRGSVVELSNRKGELPNPDGLVVFSRRSLEGPTRNGVAAATHTRSAYNISAGSHIRNISAGSPIRSADSPTRCTISFDLNVSPMHLDASSPERLKTLSEPSPGNLSSIHGETEDASNDRRETSGIMFHVAKRESLIPYSRFSGARDYSGKKLSKILVLPNHDMFFDFHDDMIKFYFVYHGYNRDTYYRGSGRDTDDRETADREPFKGGTCRGGTDEAVTDEAGTHRGRTKDGAAYAMIAPAAVSRSPCLPSYDAAAIRGSPYPTEYLRLLINDLRPTPLNQEVSDPTSPGHEAHVGRSTSFSSKCCQTLQSTRCCEVLKKRGKTCSVCQKSGLELCAQYLHCTDDRCQQGCLGCRVGTNDESLVQSKKVTRKVDFLSEKTGDRVTIGAENSPHTEKDSLRYSPHTEKDSLRHSLHTETDSILHSTYSIENRSSSPTDVSHDLEQQGNLESNFYRRNVRQKIVDEIRYEKDSAMANQGDPRILFQPRTEPSRLRSSILLESSRRGSSDDRRRDSCCTDGSRSSYISAQPSRSSGSEQRLSQPSWLPSCSETTRSYRLLWCTNTDHNQEHGHFTHPYSFRASERSRTPCKDEPTSFHHVSDTPRSPNGCPGSPRACSARRRKLQAISSTTNPAEQHPAYGNRFQRDESTDASQNARATQGGCIRATGIAGSSSDGAKDPLSKIVFDPRIQKPTECDDHWSGRLKSGQECDDYLGNSAFKSSEYPRYYPRYSSALDREDVKTYSSALDREYDMLSNSCSGPLKRPRMESERLCQNGKSDTKIPRIVPRIPQLVQVSHEYRETMSQKIPPTYATHRLPNVGRSDTFLESTGFAATERSFASDSRRFSTCGTVMQAAGLSTPTRQTVPDRITPDRTAPALDRTAPWQTLPQRRAQQSPTHRTEQSSTFGTLGRPSSSASLGSGSHSFLTPITRGALKNHYSSGTSAVHAFPCVSGDHATSSASGARPSTEGSHASIHSSTSSGSYILSPRTPRSDWYAIENTIRLISLKHGIEYKKEDNAMIRFRKLADKYGMPHSMSPMMESDDDAMRVAMPMECDDDSTILVEEMGSHHYDSNQFGQTKKESGLLYLKKESASHFLYRARAWKSIVEKIREIANHYQINCLKPEDNMIRLCELFNVKF